MARKTPACCSFQPPRHATSTRHTSGGRQDTRSPACLLVAVSLALPLFFLLPRRLFNIRCFSTEQRVDAATVPLFLLLMCLGPLCSLFAAVRKVAI